MLPSVVFGFPHSLHVCLHINHHKTVPWPRLHFSQVRNLALALSLALCFTVPKVNLFRHYQSFKSNVLTLSTRSLKAEPFGESCQQDWAARYNT